MSALLELNRSKGEYLGDIFVYLKLEKGKDDFLQDRWRNSSSSGGFFDFKDEEYACKT